MPSLVQFTDILKGKEGEEEKGKDSDEGKVKESEDGRKEGRKGKIRMRISTITALADELRNQKVKEEIHNKIPTGRNSRS